MRAVSPYLHPGWADAVWDVSGAFVNDRELVAFFDFCKLLLGFEPFHIVHGSPLCAWNSGRVLRHLWRDAEEIRVAGESYAQRQIAMYLTFSNTLLEKKDMDDVCGLSLLTFIAKHNPTRRNSVIVASECLRQLVREQFPELHLVSSILHITQCGGKGRLDIYRRLAEEFDEVMVHPDDVLNISLLEQLEDKERYILLINEYCIRNCPLRPLHYRTLSQMSTNFLADTSSFDEKQMKNGCQNLVTLLSDSSRSVLALNTPEIQRLRDLGFRHFKLQGRGHSNATLILFDLLRLVLRQDESAENAMHALGQYFFESLLPEQIA